MENQLQVLANRIHVHRFQLSSSEISLLIVWERDITGKENITHEQRIHPNHRWVSDPQVQNSLITEIIYAVACQGNSPASPALSWIYTRSGSLSCSHSTSTSHTTHSIIFPWSFSDKDNKLIQNFLSHPSLWNLSDWYGAKYSGRLSLM